MATAADHYGIPLYGYILHLRQVREQFGDEAARLDLAFAVNLQQQRAVKWNEAANKAKGVA